MRLSVLILAISLTPSASAGALAQQQTAMPPLGDIARKAEAEKPAVKKAKKTYTNSDLGKDPHGEPVPPPAVTATGFVSKSLGKSVTAEEMVERSEAKLESDTPKESEEVWRKRADTLRKQVDQLRARLTALSASDAPRSENPAVRAGNVNDIANTRAALDGLRKRWARLETTAQASKAPLAWLEPAPQFPE